ncbi:hypothetical protein [Vibrio parahaemolyticus]|uniref:hypothetical protein n=1 Tax=Vibrio parahaemolyticus TaxID=670 RepID=UPI0011213C13|nr:hypothetical protein [Vibrio parahaemolyticus]EGR1559708.1 hypothetical protein [Vibrio parahaemolyticus]TOB71822.1 hypothetical protein CGK00_23605 [Vibrio parahaemolyticus]TOF11476.1 hypothetical protein CGJ30_22135 [Vibrio parahaemolyticus]
MLEIKEFMPFFQTLLGGALTFLGVYFVQRKSDRRESDKLYRETVQQAFEALNRIETLYINEAVVFYKAIRDSNLDKIKESVFGEQASECSDKVVALLELYFPFMEEFIEEFCEIEAELVNYHNEVIDSFNEVDLETYNKESGRLSDVMAEKIAQMKCLLSDMMHKKTNF